jgi:hypothetical protein
VLAVSREGILIRSSDEIGGIQVREDAGSGRVQSHVPIIVVKAA